jgi:hypothetical protein
MRKILGYSSYSDQQKETDAVCIPLSSSSSLEQFNTTKWPLTSTMTTKGTSTSSSSITSGNHVLEKRFKLMMENLLCSLFWLLALFDVFDL